MGRPQNQWIVTKAIGPVRYFAQIAHGRVRWVRNAVQAEKYPSRNQAGKLAVRIEDAEARQLKDFT